jgi:hypothetical protein
MIVCMFFGMGVGVCECVFVIKKGMKYMREKGVFVLYFYHSKNKVYVDY